MVQRRVDTSLPLGAVASTHCLQLRCAFLKKEREMWWRVSLCNARLSPLPSQFLDTGAVTLLDLPDDSAHDCSMLRVWVDPLNRPMVRRLGLFGRELPEMTSNALLQTSIQFITTLARLDVTPARASSICPRHKAISKVSRKVCSSDSVAERSLWSVCSAGGVCTPHRSDEREEPSSSWSKAT